MVRAGLFPRTRGAVLAALLLDPERSWGLRELARHLRLSPSSVQPELAALTDEGVVRRAEAGRRVSFRAEPDCPYLDELRALVLKTCGIPEVLRAALAPLTDRIAWAFVFGSIARGDARAHSDVDVFVVGAVSRLEVADALSGVCLRFGRELNPIVRSPAAFRTQRDTHPFVRTVMAEARLDIFGDERGLGRAPTTEAHQEAGRGASHRP